MDLAFRVVQSSSILHGVHWGKFLPDTECLIVVKTHLLEAFQLTQDEKPLYCMLEQTLGFQVAASTKLRKSQQDLLVLTTNGLVHLLEFVDDYFKILKTGETGLEHIEKVKCSGEKIVCSDNQKNIIVLECKNLTISQKFEFAGSVIDWKILNYTVLVMEYDCLVKNCFWEQIDLNNGIRNVMATMNEIENFPRNFVRFQSSLLVFSEEKLAILAYPNFGVNEIRTMKGFYSSSAVIFNKLYICMDDGTVYVFDGKLQELEIRLQEDSWVLNINDLLFFISHHGQSGLFNVNGSQISRNFRSGNFIDGFFMDSWDGVELNSLVCASVNYHSSEIIKINKRTCETYQILNVSDICKYTTCVSVACGYLFLMPDLKAVNLSSFEIVQIESLNLLNERTWAIWDIEQVLWQITEKSVNVNGKIEYLFNVTCSAACYKKGVIVAGLANQSILVLSDLQLKFEIPNIDFSTLYLSDSLEIYIGLHNPEIQKFSIFGELLMKIETKGIPQSYLEHYGMLFIGSRDGILQIFKDNNHLNSKKLGHNPLNLSLSSKGIVAVAGKSYLIYNEDLDYKKINLPDSKFIIELDYFVSVSKDLTFFSIEEDLRFTTLQQVLMQVPGQINRMIKLNDGLICFSYFKDLLMVLCVFDTVTLKEKVSILLESQVTALIYIPESDLIVAGNNKSQLVFFNIELNELVSHSFQFEITAIHSYQNNFLLVASSYILFNLDCTDIYSPVKTFSQKFHSIITDLVVYQNFIVMALNLCGIFILGLENFEVISASKKKLDIKKIILHNQKIFAVSIDGWVLTRTLYDSSEFLYYTGSGARVLLPRSLYDMNLLKKNQNNLTIAGLNGEILELFPEVDKEVCEKARELFAELQKLGIIDSNQTQELNLDILRLILKLPILNTEDQITQKLLQLTN